jgi:Tol biopolymer transport system component
MGEVYRANDPALSREVALKIIRSERPDEEDRRRFEREARAASALSHPHIATVFDFGTQDGVTYLVSELINGRPLQDILGRGALDIPKALVIAQQIASALAAAHHAGIVHRDLKPANIIVAADGSAKIVDFGIAKVHGGSAEGATSTMLTAPGVLIGTTAYMSPEQLRGSDVDFRSDQFSFGVVLYEMLTGHCAFSRATAAETASAILHDEPPVPAAGFSEAVRWILERCLRKDPAFRYASTFDLCIDLVNAAERQRNGVQPSNGILQRRSRGMPATGWIAAAGLGLLLTVTVIWWWTFGQSTIDTGAFRYTPLAMEPGYEGYAAWSPDGKMLAYAGEIDGVLQIFKRGIRSVVPDQLTREVSDCSFPVWSPDGTSIYFVRDTQLWRVGAAGGQPELVHRNVQRASVSPDGLTLAMARGATDGQGGLWFASPPAAGPRRYATPPFSDRTFIIADVQFAPDGKKLGLSMISGQRPPEFWVIPFPTGAPRQLRFLANLARWHPFSWMPDSRYAVLGVQIAMVNHSQLWLADTERDRIQAVSVSTQSLTDPAVSPDGRSVAFTAEQSETDLIEIEANTGRTHRVLATAASEHAGVWLPSGEGFVYITDRNGGPELWRRVGGVDTPVVTERDFGTGRTYYLDLPAVSGDGQRVAFTRRVRGGTTSIWIAPISGGPPVRLVNSDVAQRVPAWSPDGYWIAFISMSDGKPALFRRRIGATGEGEVLKTGIPMDTRPAWSPDGQHILYGSGREMRVMSADGKNDRLLPSNNWFAHGWSTNDSHVIYGVRAKNRGYVFLAYDLRTNSEREWFPVGTNEAPIFLTYGPVASPTISLHPKGTSFLATVYNRKADLWLLEGIDQRLGILRPPWREQVPD